MVNVTNSMLQTCGHQEMTYTQDSQKETYLFKVALDPNQQVLV